MTNKEAIKILEGLAVPVGAESAFDMAIDALRRSAWIPVGDDLPEIKEHHVSETVWVTTADGYVFTDELEENIFGSKWFACERTTPYGEDNPNEVIAWKPVDVPEPYREDGEA